MKRSDIKLIVQPHNYDCQATCIAMACGGTQQSVDAIYDSLCKHGAPGDPSNINAELTYRLRGIADVSLDMNASLYNIRRYLARGALVILHGYTTISGHVFALNGLNESDDFEVLDVWSEFNGRTFSYDLGTYGFDGVYSDLLIYSTCVTSHSYEQAMSAYDALTLNDYDKGAWVHIIDYHDDRDEKLKEALAAQPNVLTVTSKDSVEREVPNV